MSNTYDADLVIDRLSDQAITVLQNRLSPLRAFSRNFGVDTMRPRATVQVEKSGTAATPARNPTTYESGDTTNTNVAVTVDERTVSFHLSSQEIMQGHQLETKAENNLRGLCDDLFDLTSYGINTLLATGTYGAAVVTTAQASMAASDLKTGWASIAKASERHVVLDSTAFAQFLPTNRESFVPGSGAYGFDGMHLQTNWTNVGTTGVKGFFCSPNAIAVAAGLPEIHPAIENQLEAMRVVTVEDLGLSVQVCLWGSTATRALWTSYGVMFGAAAGDASALSLYIPSA